MIAYFANWGASIHMADTFNRWVSPSHNLFHGHSTYIRSLAGCPYIASPYVCRYHSDPHVIPT